APSPGGRRQAAARRRRSLTRRRAGASVAPRSHTLGVLTENAPPDGVDSSDTLRVRAARSSRGCGDPRYANVPGARPLGGGPPVRRRARRDGPVDDGARDRLRARERKGPRPPSPETATPAGN